MIFEFAVRRLRWLASIPLVPQFFDACLLTQTALWHRERLAAMEMLEARVRELPDVGQRAHRMGGIGFVRADREFAHLHGNGLLDVRLTREQAAGIVAAGIAQPHHVFGPSAWVSFRISSRADLVRAMDLLTAPVSLA